MKFIVYDIEGNIIRVGECPANMISVQPHDGEFVMLGEADDFSQYISENKVVSYTKEELELKKSIPYGYRWNLTTKSIVKYLSDSEINIVKSIQVRSQRDMLLKDVDNINSVRWNSMTTEQQTAWINYRQALLDIPQQEEFPHIVTWPTKP